MYTLKIITSVFIVIFALCIGWFWNTSDKSKATDIGFGAMLIVYALSLICMWG